MMSGSHLVAVFCSSLLALALSGCGTSQDAASGETTPETTGAETQQTSAAVGAVGAVGADGEDSEEPAPSTEAEPARAAAAPSTEWDTSAWQRVLNAFVTEDGGFRYAALRNDEARMADLQAAVASIGEQNTETLGSWSEDAQLAFYINAYNVLTVASVIELWPVTSVTEEEGFFDGRTHTVAGSEMTLNALENEIIRARFNNPRIHFAVNCASTGCPWLDQASFTAENLDARLATLTQAYVRRTTQIDQQRRRIRVSQIFEWFESDFEAAGGVREFVAAQLPETEAEFVRRSSTRIAHFDYDWSLNGRP